MSSSPWRYSLPSPLRIPHCATPAGRGAPLIGSCCAATTRTHGLSSSSIATEGCDAPVVVNSAVCVVVATSALHWMVDDCKIWGFFSICWIVVSSSAHRRPVRWIAGKGE